MVGSQDFLGSEKTEHRQRFESRKPEVQEPGERWKCNIRGQGIWEMDTIWEQSQSGVSVCSMSQGI